MSLLDLVTPSKKVVITQSFGGKPEVAIEVFGLTTEDFIFLADNYAQILGAIFLRNAKHELGEVKNSGLVLRDFPGFGAAVIACGCKQIEAVDYVKTLPLLIQVELLSNIFALTFPEGLKKSLEKLAPTLALLLKK